MQQHTLCHVSGTKWLVWSWCGYFLLLLVRVIELLRAKGCVCGYGCAVGSF